MISLTIEYGSIRRITEEINPAFLGQMFQVASTRLTMTPSTTAALM